MREYDVVIAGAGPAGIAAALSAAENGAAVMLVEKAGFPGGMSTGGLLNIWCGYASSGIFCAIHDGCTVVRGPGKRHVYDPEQLKIRYLSMLQNAGVDLLLHTFVTGADLDQSFLRAIRTVGKGGENRIAGKVFIDATGDGDMAARCAVPYSMGRESDHRMQPASVMLMVGGVDETRAVYPTFGTHPAYEELMKQAVRDGLVIEPAGHIICVEGYHPGTAGVNMTNVVGVDGTDPQSLTEAEISARMQIPGIIDFLCRHLPGYEHCYLINSGAWIGIRETRHFKGEYILSEEDIRADRIFDDWVVSKARYSFGNHNLDGSGADSGNKPYLGKGYTIPYRSLIPVHTVNLLLAGRCISGTHMAHASYRVMPIYMAMGQAAGTAAAMATEHGGSVRAVDIEKLQGALMKQGVAHPGNPPANHNAGM